MGTAEAAAGRAAATDSIAVARGLTRNYGWRRALCDVDLDLKRGDFLTIFGPNGAGKTTLLKTLGCLARPTSGTLSLFGIDPKVDPDAIKRRIGLIGHAGMLYGGLGARENLVLYGRLYDLADPIRRADDLLKEMGLAHRADDPVRTFSRGMQQRLSIARGLIHDPQLVLLDEPYSGLDQEASRTLRGLLETVRGRGRTVVMVTHRLDEGLGLSNRIAIMSLGRIVHESPAVGLSREGLESLYHEVVTGAAA
ncbi:MAG TPA: ABC transporter ATP-binding protein [Candidatus Polarisedimenticolia bacterium]|nr:ABC transporter ATP-binding protein [Candidatus Polarisedimenticolia bacterium]